MKKDRKISTQGTGNDENKATTITPEKGAKAKANTGVSAQKPGGPVNEANQVTADIPADGGAGDSSNDLANTNTRNNDAQEVDVNTGGVSLERSSEATDKGNNVSNTDLAATPTDNREAVARSVDDDATKQTGRPTGAIYGSGGDIITVSDPVTSLKATKKPAAGSTKKKPTPPQTQALPVTRIYGQLHREDDSYFIKAGNVPQGQIQVLFPKEMEDQMAGYNGQYVSMAGELSKKNKADTYATMSILKIVSHDQIGQKAYELSQQNHDGHEDNWLKAENELLQL